MIRFISNILICICLVTQAFADSKGIDLRILIDVSGSMKNNDPDNNRAAALRMMTKLLPYNTEAGVWTFETYALPLVSWGEVDSSWVEQAEQEIDKIHSKGLYTNIKDAIQSSSLDWLEEPKRSGKEKIIILLTDGIVDVSKNEKINELSRKDVINNILPKLKEKGVTIHTIGLSDNSDSELLSELSLNTDGLFQQVNDASELRQVFLNIFERVVPLNTVPIEDNMFKVDKTVKELTLLLFSDNLDEKIKLELPDSKVLVSDEDVENVSWYEEGDLSLITVKGPQPGIWKIIGKLSKNNKAIIVSDFTLETSKIPVNIFVNESLPFMAQLEAKSNIIKKQSFLKLLEVYLEEPNELGSPSWTPLLDDGKNVDKEAKDGVYSVVIGPISKDFEGKNKKIKTIVKGKTFERVSTQVTKVLPFPLNIYTTSGLDEKGQKVLKLGFLVDDKLVSHKPLAMKIIVNDGVKDYKYQFRDFDKNNPWEVVLYPSKSVDKYKAIVFIQGQTVSGRNFTLKSDEQIFVVPKIMPNKKPVKINESAPPVMNEKTIDDFEAEIISLELSVDDEEENKKIVVKKEKELKDGIAYDITTSKAKNKKMNDLEQKKKENDEQDVNQDDFEEEPLKKEVKDIKDVVLKEEIKEEVVEKTEKTLNEVKENVQEEIKETQKKMVKTYDDVDFSREIERALPPGKSPKPRVFKKQVIKTEVKQKEENDSDPMDESIGGSVDEEETENKLNKVEGDLDKVEEEVGKIEEKVDLVGEKVEKIEEKVERVEERVDKVEEKVESKNDAEHFKKDDKVNIVKSNDTSKLPEDRKEESNKNNEEVKDKSDVQDDEQKNDGEDKLKTKKKKNVGLIIAIVIIINILIFGGGIGAYFFIKRRNSKKNKEVAEVEDSEEDAEDKK